mgnify:CR=1 FL=1
MYLTQVNSKKIGLAISSILLIGCAFLYYLSSFNWQISSDDAFNLSRGFERFSVLEFRPHFPGYPGLIAGIHLLALLFNSTSSEYAVINFSILSALLIPIVLAWLCYHFTNSLFTAITLALLAYSSPLLAGLALSGLSDTPALVFLLLALACALRQQLLLAALAIAIMLSIRPAYLILALAFIPFIFTQTYSLRIACLKTLLPIIFVGAACLIFILSKDGFAYFSEGLRFTQGHLDIWGNTYTKLDRGAQLDIVYQWLEQLADKIGLFTLTSLLAAMALSLIDKKVPIKIASFIASSYFIVMLFTQNPDNLRHFAPVFFLGIMLLIVQLNKVLSLHFLLPLIVLVFYMSYLPYWHNIMKMAPTSSALVKQAPVNQAIEYLEPEQITSKKLILGTNYSMNLISAQLMHFSVYDLYYPSNLRTLDQAAKDHHVWRLSGSRLLENEHQLERIFSARFPTEQDLYLYKFSNHSY